jgi:pilus assembly protein Flp/PilA
MLNYIRKITQRRGDDGASAVEYGLLVAAIAAVIVLVVFALGKFVNQSFKETCSSVSSGVADKTVASC